MPTVEFSAPEDRRRYELPFCVVSFVFWFAILVWMVPGMWVRVRSDDLSSQLFTVLLAVVSMAMIAVSGWFAFRVLFEIRKAVVAGSESTLLYRYLGARRVALPYSGKAFQNVLVPDLTSETGRRKAILIHRDIGHRVLIPMEIQGASELARMLTRPAADAL